MLAVGLRSDTCRVKRPPLLCALAVLHVRSAAVDKQTCGQVEKLTGSISWSYLCRESATIMDGWIYAIMKGNVIFRRSRGCSWWHK